MSQAVSVRGFASLNGTRDLCLAVTKYIIHFTRLNAAGCMACLVLVKSGMALKDILQRTIRHIVCVASFAGLF